MTSVKFAASKRRAQVILGPVHQRIGRVGVDRFLGLPHLRGQRVAQLGQIHQRIQPLRVPRHRLGQADAAAGTEERCDA